ncbi:secernin-2-like isoform X2 [Tubulanus polymorphus]
MGANQHGVCIGNEAIFTKLIGPETKDKKLLGMDLVRLGLERSRTATDALKVITSLLECHGQGGPCYEDPSMDFVYHNSFLIADRSEAWVLETADKWWAAEKVKDGVKHIGNVLSIGSKIDAMSDGLEEHAKSNGFTGGAAEFNFADSYRGEYPSALVDSVPTNQHPASRYAEGKRLLLEHSATGSFSVRDMFGILRNEESGICRSGPRVITTASMVSVIAPLDSTVPSTHWFTATPNPQYSVFKPFVFSRDVAIGRHTVAPRDDDATDREHTLYKHHKHAERLMRTPEGAELKNTLLHLESTCVRDVDEYVRTIDVSQDAAELEDLFKDVVESEIKFYKWGV